MTKLASFAVGLLVGAAVGVTCAYLFAPSSGAAFIANVQQGYRDTLREAKVAADSRRLELEAELARKRGQAPRPLP